MSAEIRTLKDGTTEVYPRTKAKAVYLESGKNMEDAAKTVSSIIATYQVDTGVNVSRFDIVDITDGKISTNSGSTAIALESGAPGSAIPVIFSGIFEVEQITAGQVISSTENGVYGVGVLDGVLQVFPAQEIEYINDRALPNVTASDNGKLLRVVNGKWEASAEESSGDDLRFILAHVSFYGQSGVIYISGQASQPILLYADASQIYVASDQSYWFNSTAEISSFSITLSSLSGLQFGVSTGSGGFYRATGVSIQSVGYPLLDMANINTYHTDIGIQRTFNFPEAIEGDCIVLHGGAIANVVTIKAGQDIEN